MTMKALVSIVLTDPDTGLPVIIRPGDDVPENVQALVDAQDVEDAKPATRTAVKK